jgi:hypothetical protein
MIAAPCPIIDADDARRRWRRAIISANGSQQRIITHRESETICKSGRRATTQCESEMANQTVQACCPASHGANYIVAEPLHENLLAAIFSNAEKAASADVQNKPASTTRKIADCARIPTVNSEGRRSAPRTQRIVGERMCRDDNRPSRLTNLFCRQTGWD